MHTQTHTRCNWVSLKIVMMIFSFAPHAVIYYRDRDRVLVLVVDMMRFFIFRLLDLCLYIRRIHLCYYKEEEN